MTCPDCGKSVRITTTVVIRHHSDDSWDVETPFRFKADDPVACSSCDWSGVYESLR